MCLSLSNELKGSWLLTFSRAKWDVSWAGHSKHPSAEPWSCTQDTWAPGQHLQEGQWDWQAGSDSGEPATTLPLGGVEAWALCWQLKPRLKQAAPSLPPHSQALMTTKNQHIITGGRTGSTRWVRITSQMNEQGFYLCRGESWTYSVIQQMGSCFF